MPSARRIRAALIAALALLALLRPAAAQNVSQGSLSGYGILLRQFANAAERQGRTDWFGPPYDHAGTAVLVSFDARNADITLVTPREFGQQRLLGIARTLATQVGCPDADYILRDGTHTTAVDIELNKYLHRERYRTISALDLSRLANSFKGQSLPEPVVIGIDATDSTTAVITSPGRRICLGDYWFIAPGQVPAGTSLVFTAEITPGMIVALLIPAILFIAGFVFVLRAVRKGNAAPAEYPEFTPQDVQERYNRSLPAWVVSMLFTAIAIVMPLIARTGLRRMMIAVDLLLPGGSSGFMWISMGVLILSFVTLAGATRAKRKAATQQSPAQKEAEAALGRLKPLFLLALIPLLILLVQMTIPVYTRTGLVYRRNISLVALGLIPVLLGIALYRANRGARTRLTEGVWFDMVHDIAAQAGVTVRKVFLSRSHLPNAYATPFHSVGLTSGLIELLEPEEVRAVLAHEIGHLKRCHPQRTLVITLIANACFIALWTGLESLAARQSAELGRMLSNNIVAYVFTLNLFVALATGAGRRRREREADEFAVELTGDPDLVIRALTKVHDLARQPHHLRAGDEALLAHPSLEQRIAAIRRSRLDTIK